MAVWHRRGFIRPRHYRYRSGALLVLALADLFVLDHNWADFSGLSVGQPAAGSRFFGLFLCADPPLAKAVAGKTGLSSHALAAALVAVSGDVFFRLCQAAERRSDVAQSHRSEVSL